MQYAGEFSGEACKCETGNVGSESGWTSCGWTYWEREDLYEKRTGRLHCCCLYREFCKRKWQPGNCNENAAKVSVKEKF